MIEHKHIIIRANIKNPFTPNDGEFISNWIKNLVNELGMNLLVGPIKAYVDKPGNRGWTGSCIIETSHIAMHIWDEAVPALLQLDIYTCGHLDLEVVKENLEVFKPISTEFLLLDRENKIQILKQGTKIIGDDIF